MKFNVHNEQMLDALGNLAAVVEKSQSLPILGELLVELNDDNIRLTASDLETFITQEVALTESDADDLFLSTVPAAKLFKICKAVSQDAILKFSVNEVNKATLKAGRSKFTLSGLCGDDYPTFETEKEQFSFNINSSKLAELLGKVSYAAGVKDIRHYLNGVCFDIKDSNLNVVATNGHRLAMRDIEISSDLSEDRKLIIPNKPVKLIMSILKKSGDDDVRVSIFERSIQFRIGDVELTTKLIDYEYPEYRQVLSSARVDDPSVNVATVKSELLFAALNRASIISDEPLKSATLKLSNNQLEIYVKNKNNEEMIESLGVGYSGVEANVSLNISYLIDSVKAIGEGGSIGLRITDEHSPCVLKAEGRQQVHVVMSMRV